MWTVEHKGASKASLTLHLQIVSHYSFSDPSNRHLSVTVDKKMTKETAEV